MIRLLSLAIALAAPLLPAHGTVLGTAPTGIPIVRIDAVTQTLPAQTRAVRISPALTVPPGTGVDGFLDRSKRPWELFEAAVAPRFVAGLPETGKVQPIDIGSQLPKTELVDQNGAPVDLANAFQGKVVLVAFIFTRCPDRDECPLLSAKFGALQQHLDERHFHFVEVTLDPVYDSPRVLHAYAARFGARANAWSILTGRQFEVAHVLDRFGISSLRVNDGKVLHNDKVFLTDPSGNVADIVQTTQFSTDALAAQALHLAGLGSSPLGRLKLAIVADAVALCGGSQFAGVVLLETVTFLIIAVCAFAALSWIARKLLHNA